MVFVSFWFIKCCVSLFFFSFFSQISHCVVATEAVGQFRSRGIVIVLFVVVVVVVVARAVFVLVSTGRVEHLCQGFDGHRLLGVGRRKPLGLVR